MASTSESKSAHVTVQRESISGCEFTRKVSDLLQKYAKIRALHHEDAVGIELAPFANNVRLTPRGQAGSPPGSKAADQGSVKVQHHSQSTLQPSSL